MKKIIIAAISKNNVIGNQGKIPWHSKAELKHFKQTTMGFPILMGRKTFESIGKPLPGRENIVITSSPGKLKNIQGISIFTDLESALKQYSDKEKLFIIGGGKIYNEFLPIADELLITRMPFEVEGDVYFPEISKIDYELKDIIDHDEFKVEHYVRKSNDKQ